MNGKIANSSSASSSGTRVVEMAVDCNESNEILIHHNPANLYPQTYKPYGEPEGREAVKYLTFTTECCFGYSGLAEFHPNDNSKNRQNGNANVTLTSWVFGSFRFQSQVTIHELFHTFGATQWQPSPKAPYSTTGSHCTDGIDIMCYKDSSFN